jgi:hypothetical protein|tara:strand:+ start:371 stop:643 length:273 start_codon:yes stop_codon:yes gene_type:complete
MNSKKAKHVRRRAKELMVDWIKSMIPEDQHQDITVENLDKYMPDQTHIYANRKVILSAYSYRWFIKKIKKLYNLKNININNITLKDTENV